MMEPERANKIYLVALPEEPVLGRALELQEYFSNKYQVYEAPLPPLHVTMAILYANHPGSLSAAINSLNPLLPSFLPFSLTVRGCSCFPPPYKSLNLKVVPSKKLRHVSLQAIRTLETAGIQCHSMDHWDYHISLVNPVFALREWEEKEYLEACRLLKKESIDLTCRVRRLQLWDPQFPPLRILADYSPGE